jgi:p21-activated kinase 1
MLASNQSLDSTKATGYQNSLRRPGPPIMSHTTPNANTVTPTLRQSASFTAGERPMEVTPPRAEAGVGSGPNAKRYSDETKESKATMIRKKSGFSSLMSSMRGSPRRINISDPVNPIHVTHVGYDNQTGQFTVSLISSPLVVVCRRCTRRSLPSNAARQRTNSAYL